MMSGAVCGDVTETITSGDVSASASCVDNADNSGCLPSEWAPVNLNCMTIGFWCSCDDMVNKWTCQPSQPGSGCGSSFDAWYVDEYLQDGITAAQQAVVGYAASQIQSLGEWGPTAQDD